MDWELQTRLMNEKLAGISHNQQYLTNKHFMNTKCLTWETNIWEQ